MVLNKMSNSYVTILRYSSSFTFKSDLNTADNQVSKVYCIIRPPAHTQIQKYIYTCTTHAYEGNGHDNIEQVLF